MGRSIPDVVCVLTRRVSAVLWLIAALAVASDGAAWQPSTSPDVVDARRLIDAFEYDQVTARLDEAIQTMASSSEPDIDSLVQAYELRGRAHFNLDNQELAGLDFEHVLQFKADHELTPNLSPRIVELFDAVKQRLVGVLLLSMPQPATVAIDDRVYEVGTEAAIALVQGRHRFTVRQAGYDEGMREIVIVPGVPTMLSVAMERITGTLTVVTIPDGVRVLVDDVLQGLTAPGSEAESAPFLVEALLPGSHRLRLERDCFVPSDTSFTMATPLRDQFTSPLKLAAAVATVSVGSSEGDAMVFVDGKSRGAAPVDITDLCEGPHVIEVRAPGGRFVDRRVWEAGATAALDAETRPAFALVGVAGIADRATTSEVATRVEAALAEATSVLIFSPTPAEMVEAAGDPRVGMAFSDEEATTARRRELAEVWSELVDTQGAAWLVPVADEVDSYDLWLLASNSGQPDVIRLDLSDVRSRAAALRRLAVALPPIVRTTLQTSVVDVAGIEGAAVIQVASGGAGEAAGLGRGDIIVGAAGTAVASVADLNDVVARAEPNAELSLDVRGEDGIDRSASINIALEPDTIPLEDPNLLYNKILLDLGSLRAVGGVADVAIAVNLAIAHMRLGNWDYAIPILEGTALPVGPGVSAATVDYLMAMCLIEIGEVAAARPALTRAAGSDEARLSVRGPRIAPLAARALISLP